MSITELPSPLTCRYKKIGTLDSVRTPPHGYEVSTAPLQPLNTDTGPFHVLKRTLHNSGYLFKIEKNGEVWFLAPFGQRYGWLLGQIAQTYDLVMYAQEAPE